MKFFFSAPIINKMRAENIKRKLHAREFVNKHAVARHHATLANAEERTRQACEHARSTRQRNAKALCKEHAAILAELRDLSKLLVYLRD